MCLYCTLIIFIDLIIYCKIYENENRLFNKILFKNLRNVLLYFFLIYINNSVSKTGLCKAPLTLDCIPPQYYALVGIGAKGEFHKSNIIIVG